MPNEISNTIQDSVEEFYRDVDLDDLLTEDDLRCHLFCKLKEDLEQFEDASVHAEVRWYGERRTEGSKKLQFRSDIVVIDSRTLDNYNERNFNVESKGYGFSDYFAIIELKLRRPNNGDSHEKYQKKIESDINKLKSIINKTSDANDPVYWVILIDKVLNQKKAWTISPTDSSVKEI